MNPLRMSWDPRSVNNQWFAASGTACGDGTRFLNGPITGLFGNISNGCRDLLDAKNDGAVCHQSAVVQYPAPVDILVPLGFAPSQRHHDPVHQFRHNADMSATIPGLGSIGPLMCGSSGNVGQFFLTDPPTTSDLFLTLVGFLNAL